MKVEDIQIEKIGLFQFYLIDKTTGETATAEFTNIPKKIAIGLINQQIESFKVFNFIESIDIIHTSKIGMWVDVNTNNYLLRFFMFSK